MFYRRRAHAMPLPAAPRRRNRRGVHDWFFGFVTFCAALVVVVFVVDRAIDGIAALGLFTDRTTDTSPTYVSVAGRHLTVPSNMIRFSRERTGGDLKQLDLAVAWPSLNGYSEALAGQFNDVGPASTIIDIAIRPRHTTTDTAGRLATIYEHFFGNQATDAPEGLTGYHLTPESGLENETVYFESGSTQPYAVHCADFDPRLPAKAQPPALCLREIHAGEAISIQIRFHKGLLTDWRAMDVGLRRLLAQIGLFS